MGAEITRHRFPSLLASLLAASLVAAACSDSSSETNAGEPVIAIRDDESPDTSATTSPAASSTTTVATTTTQPPSFAEAWSSVASGTTDDGIRAVDAVAGDIMGVGVDFPEYRVTDIGIFRFDPADGWEEETNLVALGLPVDVVVDFYPGSFPGSAAIAGDATVRVAAVSLQPTPGASADGVSGDLWVALDTGAGWDLLSPADTGRDQRLAGPANFRFSSIIGAVVVDGSVHVALQAQWWEPFLTSGAEFAVVSRAADGTWSTFASQDDWLDSSWFRPAAIVADEAGTIVVPGKGRAGERSEFAAWVSADNGGAWSRIPDPPPLPDEVSSTTVVDAAYGAPGFVVVGYEEPPDVYTEQQPVLWASTDGFDWDRRLIAGPGIGSQPASITYLPDVGYVMSTDQDELWSSPDAVEWTRVSTDEISFSLGRATLLNVDGRLAVVGSSQTAFSPPRPID